MKIFFDTEFTGLRNGTTLISIGLISEDGKTFYAEFTDYDKSQCDEWIKKNVLENLVFSHTKEVEPIADYMYKGTKQEICIYLSEFLKSFNDTIELISDVCHYDMMLFIDIFGDAINLPDYISPCCYDINQDISWMYNCNQKEAFNLNREEILTDIFHQDIPIGRKHNSMYDSKVIKLLYEKIMSHRQKIKNVY